MDINKYFYSKNLINIDEYCPKALNKGVKNAIISYLYNKIRGNYASRRYKHLSLYLHDCVREEAQSSTFKKFIKKAVKEALRKFLTNL